LLKTALPNGSSQWHGIVCFLSLDQEGDAGYTPALAEQISTEVLHLIQVLSLADTPARLWLITQGSQAISDFEPVALAQAPPWGLARTARLEHPQIKCVSIDLPAPPEDADIDALCSELALPGDEAQVAFRSRERHVARLALRQESSGEEDKM
jgi:hypothetical protein